MAALGAPISPHPHGSERPGASSSYYHSTKSASPSSGGKAQKQARPAGRDPSRSARPPYYASRPTVASTLRASPQTDTSEGSELQTQCRISAAGPGGSIDGTDISGEPSLEAYEFSDAHPAASAPLSHYQGPTPKTVDEIREAYFATKGLSLSSIKEWEWHCFNADMGALAIAAKSKAIDGEITGYDENDGFSGSAATCGTLKLWLLSQAKFNELKTIELWARLSK